MEPSMAVDPGAATRQIDAAATGRRMSNGHFFEDLARTITEVGIPLNSAASVGANQMPSDARL
jgi:hypothetical protein